MMRILLFAIAFVLFSTALYVPSRYPPGEFVRAIQMESDSHRELWGDVAADRVWQRTGRIYEEVMPNSPPAEPAEVGGMAKLDVVGAVASRAWVSDYFRSAQTLLALVIYRVCAIFELALLAVLVFIVTVVDGLMVRKVRAREFLPHSAELFTVSISASLLIAGLILLSLVLPIAVPPWLNAVAIILMIFILSRAVANYHLIR